MIARPSLASSDPDRPGTPWHTLAHPHGRSRSRCVPGPRPTPIAPQRRSASIAHPEPPRRCLASEPPRLHCPAHPFCARLTLLPVPASCRTVLNRRRTAFGVRWWGDPRAGSDVPVSAAPSVRLAAADRAGTAWHTLAHPRRRGVCQRRVAQNALKRRLRWVSGRSDEVGSGLAHLAHPFLLL